jgi:hypothetical protein
MEADSRNPSGRPNSTTYDDWQNGISAALNQIGGAMVRSNLAVSVNGLSAALFRSVLSW